MIYCIRIRVALLYQISHDGPSCFFSSPVPSRAAAGKISSARHEADQRWWLRYSGQIQYNHFNHRAYCFPHTRILFGSSISDVFAILSKNARMLCQPLLFVPMISSICPSGLSTHNLRRPSSPSRVHHRAMSALQLMKPLSPQLQMCFEISSASASADLARSVRTLHFLAL